MTEYTFYKIVCKDLSVKELYVGSTKAFRMRKWYHKRDCTNIKSKAYNYKLYQFIRKNGNFYNWDLIEIERKICKDLQEARKYEREWIEKLNATLNTTIPGRTMKEYCEDNKQKRRDNTENWRVNNKEKVNIKQKEYRKKVENYICDKCGKELKYDSQFKHRKNCNK